MDDSRHPPLLAYSRSRYPDLYMAEGEIYKRWLATQPSAVERVPYTTPTKILGRPSESSEGSISDRRDQAECAAATTEPLTEMEAEVEHRAEACPKPAAHSDRVSEGSEVAQLKLEEAYLAAATVSEDWGDRDAPNAIEHPANAIEFKDYTRELAFLPDLTEAASTTLDYTGPHVRHPSLSVEQQDRVVKVLKSHERIMIASGNALPPPAHGVVCDIDVQGHPPIKQKARRIPLRHLKQLYELLKGLLKAGLIAFSDSPWASPIVIVLKKNGVDIRLCIDYKMVNSVAAILEYAMPLGDALLTDMEKYLWYCSLDAASGFWAVMMTQRAWKMSAFVCALGHFEWLRMPFGLKNAPLIYQRMIDNALWGFVQPRGGWSAFAERVRMAEAADAAAGGSPTDAAIHGRTRFEADRESSDIPDSLSAVLNDPRGDIFASGEADQSSLAPVFERRSFVDDICFGGESFDSCLETLDRLFFEECRISVSFAKSMFVQPTLDFLSHAVSLEGLRADARKLKAITEISFPKTKKGVQAFLSALIYYSRFIQDFAVYGAALYQVREENFGPGGELSTAKRSFAALQAKVADAPILKHFDGTKEVHVMLFANDWALSTTLMQEHDGVMHPVRFCGRVLKVNEVNYHPAEKEVLAQLLLLKTCYTQLAGLRGHAVSWHLVVHRVTEDDSAFAQLLHSTITNFVGLDKALQRVAPPSKRTPMVRMDPELLYARLPNDHRGFVLSFDGSAKTPKHGGYGSCAWILWRLPDWKIEIAASAYLENTTVNQAEYMGMNEGLRAAQAYGATDLVVVGDSRLAIQQSLGDRMPEGVAFDSAEHTPGASCEVSIRQISPRHPGSRSKLEQLNRIHEVIYERPNREVTQVSTLRALPEDTVTQRDNFYDFALKPRFITAITRQQAQTAKKRVRFADTHDEDSEALPMEPEPPDRPNDATTESSHVEMVKYPPEAQEEELRWANLKSVLKGESSSLGYKAAREAWKMADGFVLSEDGLLYFLGENRRWGKDRMNKTVLRLVVPTTMVQEVLQSCHDSLEGGHQGIVRTFHRVKADYYWVGLYADVERHVRSCPDCSSSKSRHQLRGYSPGNILAERSLPIVSMDFVIPLPKSRRGNTALLLFQCAFTGFAMAKAMSDTSALCVAQACEECVYRTILSQTRPRPPLYERSFPSLCGDDAISVAGDFELSATSQ
ncbi:unnamed protein product [Phytophthora fragariaefolia]|uniref:Unnamed protein product n=1 Tax=Phytophthora fragariaefolia TaxID=1490495 RepID=A0A9W7D8A9_9STRA|nr:unnamed protein product [Phytophthora fragariaefolia]